MIYNSNPLQIVSLPNHQVRSVSIYNKVTDYNEVWFVLADFLGAVESKTIPSHAATSIRDELGDKHVQLVPIASTDNRELSVNIISLPAALFLTSRSRTPAGQRLNEFLFEEVLPCIIRHGAYIPNMTKRDVEYLREREAVSSLKALDELTPLQLNNVLRETTLSATNNIQSIVSRDRLQAAQRAVCWKELKKRRGFTKDSQVFDALLAVGVIRHSEYAQGYDLTPLGHEYAVNLGELHNPITGICWDPLLLDAIREQS